MDASRKDASSVSVRAPPLQGDGETKKTWNPLEHGDGEKKAAYGSNTALHREADASASSVLVTLLLVGATPTLLVIAPPSLPIRITCVTIVRLGCGFWATHLLVRTTP